ncbi:MAG TPA: DUF2924 domain-containing protein [Caulobacteraceae bacterium]|nr:DUF2924 domain-containing protein [Caulobacteraceae bacterium]
MSLDDDVRALEAMDLEALRGQWRPRFGAPPGLRSVDLLRRLLAWRMQADVHGDLGADLRRQLRSTATPRPFDRRVRPGARVAREWQGQRYEVEVVDGGFLHAGARYNSLSEIARAITGTQWNGPRFFGLRGGGEA